jgi:pimeloyl-ACP methyl ester carboxylesterase
MALNPVTVNPAGRRSALVGVSAVAAMAAGAVGLGMAGAAQAASHAVSHAGGTPAPTRAPLVLVHGAWHGAWCWRAVRRALAAAGHEVFTPTLTGMGERHHLGNAQTTLLTHIADVAALIETEELQGAIVVAHSYAGYPCTGALERVAARVGRLVYLDAMLPVPGKASADFWPPQAVAGVKATLKDGFRLASFPPAAFGVPEGHPEHAWLARRLTDMPYGALDTPYPASAPAPEKLPVPARYIRCLKNALPDTRAAAARAEAIGLTVLDLDAAHDAMVVAPEALTKLLLDMARA